MTDEQINNATARVNLPVSTACLERCTGTQVVEEELSVGQAGVDKLRVKLASGS